MTNIVLKKVKPGLNIPEYVHGSFLTHFMQLRQSKGNVEKHYSETFFTQEMRGDSDPQPRDTDHPTSLTHSDLTQQNGTSVDRPSTREDMVSKYLSCAK